MKITRDTNGDITISNLPLITNLLAANGLNDRSPSPTPHIDGQDTFKTTDADILTGKTAYRSKLGSCRFLADTTHPQLAFIIGSLGRHAQIRPPDTMPPSSAYSATSRACKMETCHSHTPTNRWPWRPTAIQIGHSALTPAAQPQVLTFSSTALLSTTFHQSNRPLPSHPQSLNLSPPTSPPGVSPSS
jgi:hypothetical protein